MTHAQQQALLRKHLAAFFKHQRAATAALAEITAICLCETEGNPLNSAIQGEDALRAYAAGKGAAPFEAGELDATIEAAKATLETSGYVI
jgi:hypothetical protein